MIQQNYIKIYEKAFRELWALPALTNYSTGVTYSYSDVAKWIAKVHIQLDCIGVQEGDKIALIAKDSAEWCMVYLGVLTYGAVVVPILPDFHKSDIHNIINHSDAIMVYSSDKHLEMLDVDLMPKVRAVIDLTCLCVDLARTRSEAARYMNTEVLFTDRYPQGFERNDVRYREIPNESVMVINYTSGTTGFSKGVILTGNNLAGNVLFANGQKMMLKNERMLCFLPLAHAYSCAFNFLTPIQSGTHIFILGSLPTPTILSRAFSEVKPNLIISVPLILEKIYKSVILPEISKPLARLLLKTPIVCKAVRKKIRNRLVEALGGNFKEVIIGGAPMSEEVTDFLYEIGFPFTIGYGMTECAPLVSYSPYRSYVPLSCGRPLKGYMEVRIDESSEGLENGVGEIQVRGENVCKGYYKNSEATEALFTSDGWMRTGDLGVMDKKGNIFIKGRSKTMLLSSAGQNIYPEEIEAKLNLMPYVSDSLVVQRTTSQLVALVYPDYTALRAAGIQSESEIEKIMETNRQDLNGQIANYEKITRIKIRKEDFERTPKKSIKRYLYLNEG